MADFAHKGKGKNIFPIKAETWNAILDAGARAEAEKGTSRPTATPLIEADTIVRVKNTSSRDLDAGDILGLKEPRFLPDENRGAFLRRPLWLGEIATEEQLYDGRLCVLTRPLPAEATGPAVVSGLVAARVFVGDDDAWLGYADTRPSASQSEEASLLALPCGNAEILWREEGTGLKWAIVRLGKYGGLDWIEIKLTSTLAAYDPEADPPTYATAEAYEKPGGDAREIHVYPPDWFRAGSLASGTRGAANGRRGDRHWVMSAATC